MMICTPDEYKAGLSGSMDGELADIIADAVVRAVSEKLRQGNVRSQPPKLRVVVDSPQSFAPHLTAKVEAKIVDAFSDAGWTGVSVRYSAAAYHFLVLVDAA